ncbi:MAG: hypothetical protein JO271_10720, partial [Verrucomicrobia bacterium]|nr:hypothetical protein [Verrucomicrobiota bacterium]
MELVCWRQVALFGIITITSPLSTQAHQAGWKWAASWTTAPQDVFPGSSTPALVNFAFPNPTVGANNQTLRMIIKPDLWSNKVRLRFSNYWGTQPVTLGHVMVGLQAYSGNLVLGTVASIVVSLTAAWGLGDHGVKTLAGAATLNRLEVRPPGRGRRLVMVSY